jgi:hypothetical protein
VNVKPLGSSGVNGLYLLTSCYNGKPLYARSNDGSANGRNSWSASGAWAAFDAASASAGDTGGGADTSGSNAAQADAGTDARGVAPPFNALLWYSNAFGDWVVTEGCEPDDSNVLLFGGSLERASMPMFVRNW